MARMGKTVLFLLVLAACTRKPSDHPTPQPQSPPPPAAPELPKGLGVVTPRGPTAVLTPPMQQAPPPGPPPDARGLNSAGVQAYSSNKLDEAIGLFTKCLDNDRNYFPCYRNLGVTYERKGDTKQAAKYYKAFLKVSPKNKEADEVRQLLKQVSKGGKHGKR